MKKTKARFLPRRNLTKGRLPSWCIFIKIAGRRRKGNGNIEMSHLIRFGAFNGGNAKFKVLPKLQIFLDRISWEFCGSPRVDGLLEKVSTNGNGNRRVPRYKIREKMCYMNALIREKRASKVFVEV